MNQFRPLGPVARLARRPVPVLLGTIMGFLGCCLAGREAATWQPFLAFARFHPGNSSASQFYPPTTQVLNLAREHVKPGKILVVVGGNSVLNGVGQRESHIWTRELQSLLGERYVVLNLAQRGFDAYEFGGLVAECLVEEGAPVIYVTGGFDAARTTPVQRSWEGSVYRTFFWDAWGKGLVPSDHDRDHWLVEEFYGQSSTGSPDRELRHGGTVDGVAYAGVLWNTVAYEYASTVWTPLTYPNWWRPHRELPDDDVGDDVPSDAPSRMAEPYLRAESDRLRTQLHHEQVDAVLRGAREEAVLALYRKCRPARLADRTLIVLRMVAVDVRERLSPDDRGRYMAISQRVPEILSRGGLHAQLVSQDYSRRDYCDPWHFSESGGRKLARDLAPTIRSMAAELHGQAGFAREGVRQ